MHKGPGFLFPRERAAYVVADAADAAVEIVAGPGFVPIVNFIPSRGGNALRYVLDWLSSKWIHRVVQNAGLAPRNARETETARLSFSQVRRSGDGGGE